MSEKNFSRTIDLCLGAHTKKSVCPSAIFITIAPQADISNIIKHVQLEIRTDKERLLKEKIKSLISDEQEALLSDEKFSTQCNIILEAHLPFSLLRNKKSRVILSFSDDNRRRMEKSLAIMHWPT